MTTKKFPLCRSACGCLSTCWLLEVAGDAALSASRRPLTAEVTTGRQRSDRGSCRGTGVALTPGTFPGQPQGSGGGHMHGEFPRRHDRTQRKRYAGFLGNAVWLVSVRRCGESKFGPLSIEVTVWAILACYAAKNKVRERS